MESNSHFNNRKKKGNGKYLRNQSGRTKRGNLK